MISSKQKGLKPTSKEPKTLFTNDHLAREWAALFAPLGIQATWQPGISDIKLRISLHIPLILQGTCLPEGARLQLSQAAASELTYGLKKHSYRSHQEHLVIGLSKCLTKIILTPPSSGSTHFNFHQVQISIFHQVQISIFHLDQDTCKSHLAKLFLINWQNVFPRRIWHLFFEELIVVAGWQADGAGFALNPQVHCL